MTGAATRRAARELSDFLDRFLEEFAEPMAQEIMVSVSTPRFDDLTASADRLLSFRERVRKLARRQA